MSSTNLKCKNCRRIIPAKNINLASYMAKCDHCNHIFNFTPQLSIKTIEEDDRAAPPEGIDILRLNSQLDIDIAWRHNPITKFLVFFVFFWDFVVLVLLTVFLASGVYEIIWVLSIHLIMAFAMNYWLAVVFFNRTNINVNERALEIKHKPLYWPFYPNRYINIADIQQLYCTRYIATSTNGQPAYAYEIQLRTTDNKDIKLIKGLPDANYAKYLEQEIEQYLGIQDTPVIGDLDTKELV
jgi:hypothetical protein